MRLATEIEFAKGFACAAPAMYRNFSVITMYNVMSMCSACNVSQLQCNYNVSVWSAYHLLQLQCNYSVATLCSACNVSQLQCNYSVIAVQLQCVARAMFHNYSVTAV